MASPAFRSAGSLAADTGGAPAVPYPAGLAAGDLLVIQYCTSSITPTTPSGWTKLFGPVAGSDGANGKFYVYYKIASGSESGSLTIAVGSGAGDAAAIMSAYTGVDGTTPINVSATASLPTSGTSVTTPTVTTTVADTTLLRMYWGWTASGVTVTPAGSDTERYDSRFVNLAFAIEMADHAQAATGATGTTTATFSSTSFGGLGATIALAPGAGGGGGAAFVPQIVIL